MVSKVDDWKWVDSPLNPTLLIRLRRGMMANCDCRSRAAWKMVSK